MQIPDPAPHPLFVRQDLTLLAELGFNVPVIQAFEIAIYLYKYTCSQRYCVYCWGQSETKAEYFYCFVWTGVLLVQLDYTHTCGGGHIKVIKGFMADSLLACVLLSVLAPDAANHITKVASSSTSTPMETSPKHRAQKLWSHSSRCRNQRFLNASSWEKWRGLIVSELVITVSVSDCVCVTIMTHMWFIRELNPRVL